MPEYTRLDEDLRIYGRLEPWIEKTWRPGEIELID